MSVDRTPKPCQHPRANHQHGTRLAYMLDRCRCLPCSAANSAYETRRVQLKAYGRGTPTGLVDATPARTHVEKLQAARPHPPTDQLKGERSAMPRLPHQPPDTGPLEPSDEIRDAAYNAVAVASLAHTQARLALGAILVCAHSKGLTVDQLCDASGLDETYVRRLLDEAAL
jgi:hypothetical protein